MSDTQGVGSEQSKDEQLLLIFLGVNTTPEAREEALKTLIEEWKLDADVVEKMSETKTPREAALVILAHYKNQMVV